MLKWISFLSVDLSFQLISPSLLQEAFPEPQVWVTHGIGTSPEPLTYYVVICLSQDTEDPYGSS